MAHKLTGEKIRGYSSLPLVQSADVDEKEPSNQYEWISMVVAGAAAAIGTEASPATASTRSDHCNEAFTTYPQEYLL